MDVPVILKARDILDIAGKRLDVWFYGPDGYIWHGVQYGDNTQIVHCKRSSERVQRT